MQIRWELVNVFLNKAAVALMVDRFVLRRIHPLVGMARKIIRRSGGN